MLWLLLVAVAVAFMRRSLKGRKISLHKRCAVCPTATISKLNSQSCKCQAFITHNLFISLHIKLVNVFSCYESDLGCMQTTMMNDCLNYFAP